MYAAIQTEEETAAIEFPSLLRLLVKKPSDSFFADFRNPKIKLSRNQKNGEGVPVTSLTYSNIETRMDSPKSVVRVVRGAALRAASGRRAPTAVSCDPFEILYQNTIFVGFSSWACA